MPINYWPQLSLLFLFSYFVGNFCAAVVISNKFIRKDIRELGSKNPGTTNMTRIFGIKYGAATFIIDFLKSFVCVLAGKMIFTSIGGAEVGLLAGYLAGLAVMLGHNYPVLLGFKGGKGFAPGIGAFVAVNPIITLILLLAGLVLLLIIDRMSVLALTFFAAEAIYLSEVHVLWWISIFAWGYFILAAIAHWPNIIRLVHGQERPLGIIDIIKSAI